MKISFSLSFLLIALLSPALAQSKDSCPDLTGSYSYIKANSVILDLAKVFNLGLLRDNSGELEIKGNSSNELSFFWKREKDMDIISDTKLKFNKDYKCDKGQIVFINKVKSFRNDLPGLYEGESLIKLSSIEPYSGLNVESNFNGRENITIFSYDSANVSFLKWWGKKMLVESIVLNTTPNIPSDNSKNIKIESANIIKAKEIFNTKIVGSLFLGGFRDKGNSVLVSLTAPQLSDIESFKERLQRDLISYEIETKPIWTSSGSSRGYYVEFLIKTD